MPKQGYRVIAFYNDAGWLASVEILTTQEANHLVSAFKVGAEKRNFKVFRLGALLEKCSRESESGITPRAVDVSRAVAIQTFQYKDGSVTASDRQQF